MYILIVEINVLSLRCTCILCADLASMCFASAFYIHGSVHRDSILIRSNEMQQYAGVYLLQNYSTRFGCLSHPSSGVH